MKDTTRTATVAVLVVFAVAFAAASLDTTTVPERGGTGGPVSGNGSGQGGLLPPPQTTPTAGEPLRIPFVGEILTVLAALAAVGFVAYVIVYRREALGIVAAVAVLLALLLLLFQFLSAPETPRTMAPGEGVLFGRGGGSGEAETTRTGRPPPALVFVVGAVVAGVALALFGTTGGNTDDDADDGGNGGHAGTAAVGRAAGRAADRLEAETGVENEVYRTWREMTELLDVDDPETSTPREFAAAAVEAGLGRADVDELTRLFEEVRYGGASPSDDHERRAIAVFRRIEARYADAEGEP